MLGLYCFQVCDGVAGWGGVFFMRLGGFELLDCIHFGFKCAWSDSFFQNRKFFCQC